MDRERAPTPKPEPLPPPWQKSLIEKPNSDCNRKVTERFSSSAELSTIRVCVCVRAIERETTNKSGGIMKTAETKRKSQITRTIITKARVIVAAALRCDCC